MYECQYPPLCGHRGREKTYLTVSRDFYWLCQYQFLRKCIRSCEICQRVAPTLHPVRHDNLCWYRKSCGSPFRWTSSFGPPKTVAIITLLFVLVDRFIKIVHFAAVPGRSKHKAVPVSSSTWWFDSTDYLGPRLLQKSLVHGRVLAFRFP